jgi:hypothetical protein
MRIYSFSVRRSFMRFDIACAKLEAQWQWENGDLHPRGVKHMR